MLFGSRARGEARPGSDLGLLLIVAGSLTQERERALRSRARALLLPLLPVRAPHSRGLMVSPAAARPRLRWRGSSGSDRRPPA
ncbi:MAG: nucleotidyltransferase domain-containing protein [Cyanobium sp.]